MRLRSRRMCWGRKRRGRGIALSGVFRSGKMVAFCGVLLELELVVWWDISGVLAGWCYAFATYLPLQR